MENTKAKVGELNKDNSVRSIIVRGEERAFSPGFELKAAAECDMKDVWDWES